MLLAAWHQCFLLTMLEAPRHTAQIYFYDTTKIATGAARLLQSWNFSWSHSFYEINRWRRGCLEVFRQVNKDATSGWSSWNNKKTRDVAISQNWNRPNVARRSATWRNAAATIKQILGSSFEFRPPLEAAEAVQSLNDSITEKKGCQCWKTCKTVTYSQGK